MLWKKSPAGVDVLVFSQHTGEPMAGATTLLMDSNENESLTQATTDANGLAHLHSPIPARGRWIAMQQQPGFSRSPYQGGTHLELREFNLPHYGSDDEREETNRVMLFSDRDLYRPGEEMHLEALVRNWTGSRLAVVPRLTGTLECVDPQGHKFFRTNAVSSSMGSWSTLVPLPSGSRGFYSRNPALPAQTTATSDIVSGPGFSTERLRESACLARRAITRTSPSSCRFPPVICSAKNSPTRRFPDALEASDTPFHAEGFRNSNSPETEWNCATGAAAASISLTGHGMLTGHTTWSSPRPCQQIQQPHSHAPCHCWRN